MAKQRVQYINKAYTMFNSCGVNIKKTDITSNVGFERAMNSREWSKVKVIRKSRKVSGTETATLAETVPGYENLISIKGIGTFSAATFLVTIGDIGNFPKLGNLAAYIGTAPYVSQSNDTQLVDRITKRDNKTARTGLVQFALIAIKYSPHMRDFYEGIKSRRGSSKTIIAVAGKLLNTIFYALRNERYPNHGPHLSK